MDKDFLDAVEADIDGAQANAVPRSARLQGLDLATLQALILAERARIAAGEVALQAASQALFRDSRRLVVQREALRALREAAITAAGLGEQEANWQTPPVEHTAAVAVRRAMDLLVLPTEGKQS